MSDAGPELRIQDLRIADAEHAAQRRNERVKLVASEQPRSDALVASLMRGSPGVRDVF